MYTRKRDDLIVTQPISLLAALTGVRIVLKKLDNTDLVLTTRPGEVIGPDAVQCVRGHGMPRHGNPFQFGDLYVKFEIQFPESGSLSERDVAALSSALPQTPDCMIFSNPSEYSSSKMDEDGEATVEHAELETVDLEVKMREAEARERAHKSAAYDSDDEDTGGRGQRVQCAQQ